MKRSQKRLLRQFASKYIWWKSPEQAMQRPERIAAQVMNIGDYDDVQRFVDGFGTGYLRQVLANAGAGQLNERSWHYWHYRLGMAKPGKVPPLPKRRVG
ncbi:MAG TPA: hypothetical protein VGF43_08500 [Dongiaceae bacterium]|jgi:hypothetical protein